MNNATTPSPALVTDESPDAIRVARPEWMNDAEWASTRQTITARIDELVHRAKTTRPTEERDLP